MKESETDKYENKAFVFQMFLQMQPLRYNRIKVIVKGVTQEDDDLNNRYDIQLPSPKVLHPVIYRTITINDFLKRFV